VITNSNKSVDKQTIIIITVYNSLSQSELVTKELATAKWKVSRSRMQAVASKNRKKTVVSFDFYKILCTFFFLYELYLAVQITMDIR